MFIAEQLNLFHAIPDANILGLASDAKLAIFRINNDALSDEKLPTRLKLLDWGENDTIKGQVKVGTRTLSALPENQDRYGFDTVAIDFDHNSVKSSPNYQEDPREVAAYGTPEVIEGEGLFLNNIMWTPAGEKYARSYKDLSPAVIQDENGEVIFLHSTALCPQGAVKNLTFFSAAFLQPETKTTIMSTTSKTEKGTAENLADLGRKALTTIMNVPADISDDELSKLDIESALAGGQSHDHAAG